jgi:hypothetical protein
MNRSNTNLREELEHMYARTEHWISDYAFFDDEIKFLINLLDRYFLGIIISDGSTIEVLRSKARKLLELDNERESIVKENQETLSHIAKLLKNEVAFDPQEFREEYADIENAQTAFLKRYRDLKREIFSLSAELQKTTPA